MSELEFVATVCVLFFGGFVKGSIGFGTPLVAAPLLALFLAPQNVVTMLALPLLVTNITDTYRLRSEWRALGEIWLYLLCALAFIPVGVWFLGFGDPDFIRLMMGVMAYTYLLVESRLASFKELGAGFQRIVGAMMGATLGFVYGTTTISGAINMIYFSMLRLAKNPFIFLMNAFNTSGMFVIIASLTLQGFYTKPRLTSGLLAIIPVCIGYLVGIRVRERIDQALFFRLIRIALFLIATSLVLKFIMGKM
ncbi:MAG: sulfite exporter TauE/SafE family protein [Nitrospinae bacterium]|nr:sulfite exporter TauE/SafE family protein [Nitrospinota bacterium]